MRNFIFNRNLNPIISRGQGERGSMLILTLFSSEEKYGMVNITNMGWEFTICSMEYLPYLIFVTPIGYMVLGPFYREGTEKLFFSQSYSESVVCAWESCISNESG